MKEISSALLGITVFFVLLDLWGVLKVWPFSPGLAGARARSGWLNSRMKKILKKALAPLNDEVLWDEIAFSLAFHIKAGDTVVGAIKAVSEEGSTRGHEALKRVFHLYQAGTPLLDALDGVSQEDPDLSRVAGILETGISTGGNLPALLCYASEAFRRRRLLKGEIRAKLSEARFTALILSVLPWLLVFLMLRYDSRALSILRQVKSGRFLVMVSFVLWATGVFLVIYTIRSLSPGKGLKR